MLEPSALVSCLGTCSGKICLSWPSAWRRTGSRPSSLSPHPLGAGLIPLPWLHTVCLPPSNGFQRTGPVSPVRSRQPTTLYIQQRTLMPLHESIRCRFVIYLFNKTNVHRAFYLESVLSNNHVAGPILVCFSIAKRYSQHMPLYTILFLSLLLQMYY